MYTENSSDHFRIDANSGEIRTTTVLVFDERPSYRITVFASDQGLPPLQGQALIIIQVSFPHHHVMQKSVLKVSFDFHTCVE